jgi:acyl-CoA synthetase (AMP-forming)/AMP-acid ligase II
VAKIGAVVVPLSPMLRGQGLVSLLNDSDSVMAITDASFAPILDAVKNALPAIAPNRYLITDAPDSDIGYQNYHVLCSAASDAEPPAIDIADDDPYNIIYSSGTTGMPKGIVHTHGIRTWYCTSLAIKFRMTPESVVLHAGSIVFNGAFTTIMPAMYVGATYVLLQQFDPVSFIEAIARERATHLMMVPSQIIAMMNASNFDSERLKSLQMLCSVGAPMHLEHKQELERQLPGVFHELYGLTEGFLTVLDNTDFHAKPTSVGVPLPFYEMKIVDENGDEVASGEVGEIIGHGPKLMPGYYKRPDLTAQAVRDGWLYTGDLGYVDDDGYLYLVDRAKDMIISGGLNVYPRDIEEIIVQHPAVYEAVVFGIPSDKWGETPLAMVILHPLDAISAEDLRAWINERVSARYQQVHEVVIASDFPRSVAGKTLKRVLREPYWAGREKRI